jgi:hypothetical protein
MNPHKTILCATACCVVLAGTLVAQAQIPQPKHPAKAAPSAPLTQPAVAVTAVKTQGVSVLPKKPPVVTAVNTNAPHPGSPVDRTIIFVGGKPRAGSNAALNTQPIPPGIGGPVNPPR